MSFLFFSRTIIIISCALPGISFLGPINFSDSGRSRILCQSTINNQHRLVIVCCPSSYEQYTIFSEQSNPWQYTRCSINLLPYRYYKVTCLTIVSFSKYAHLVFKCRVGFQVSFMSRPTSMVFQLFFRRSQHPHNLKISYFSDVEDATTSPFAEAYTDDEK